MVLRIILKQSWNAAHGGDDRAVVASESAPNNRIGSLRQFPRQLHCDHAWMRDAIRAPRAKQLLACEVPFFANGVDD
jgi:hypothetical protein